MKNNEEIDLTEIKPDISKTQGAYNVIVNNIEANDDKIINNEDIRKQIKGMLDDLDLDDEDLDIIHILKSLNKKLSVAKKNNKEDKCKKYITEIEKYQKLQKLYKKLYDHESEEKEPGQSIDECQIKLKNQELDFKKNLSKTNLLTKKESYITNFVNLFYSLPLNFLRFFILNPGNDDNINFYKQINIAKSIAKKCSLPMVLLFNENGQSSNLYFFAIGYKESFIFFTPLDISKLEWVYETLLKVKEKNIFKNIFIWNKEILLDNKNYDPLLSIYIEVIKEILEKSTDLIQYLNAPSLFKENLVRFKALSYTPFQYDLNTLYIFNFLTNDSKKYKDHLKKINDKHFSLSKNFEFPPVQNALEPQILNKYIKGDQSYETVLENLIKKQKLLFSSRRHNSNSNKSKIIIENFDINEENKEDVESNSSSSSSCAPLPKSPKDKVEGGIFYKIEDNLQNIKNPYQQTYNNNRSDKPGPSDWDNDLSYEEKSDSDDIEVLYENRGINTRNTDEKTEYESDNLEYQNFYLAKKALSIHPESDTNSSIDASIINFDGKIPDCSYKNIQNIINLLSKKVEKEEIKQEKNQYLELTKEIDKLKENINKEDPENKIEILSAIEKVEKGYIPTGNWKLALNEIQKLKHKIIYFDTILLKKLLTKTAPINNIVNEEDIILLLGESGVGKSTAIHYFSGSKFIKTNQEGIESYQPLNPNSALKDVTISALPKSETIHITVLPLQLKKDLKINSYGQDKICICDTPGFADTRGPEIDIANNISIIRMIEESNSIIPVIVISKDSLGENMSGLNLLVQFLTEMIINPQDNLGYFNFLFTKFKKDEIKQLNFKLKQLLEIKGNDKRTDIKVLKMLEHMFDKTDNFITINYFHPMDGNRTKVLKKLLNNDKIDKPSEVFRISVSSKTLETLKKQLEIDNRNIRNALMHGDFSLVKYKLNEKKYLVKILDSSNSIKHSYNEIKKDISTYINGRIKNAITEISRLLKIENTLFKKDIEEYRKLYDTINQNHQNIYTKHNIDNVYSPYNMEREVNEYVNKLINSLMDDEDSNKIVNVLDPLFKKKLDNLKLLADYFKFAKMKYKSVQKIINSYLIELYKNSENYVKEAKFEDLYVNFNIIKTMLNFLGGHILDLEKNKKQFKNTLSILENELDFHLKIVLKKLDNNLLTKKDIEAVKISFEKIFKIKVNKNIFIFNSNIDEIEKKIVQKIEIYLRKIAENIKSSYRTLKANSFSQIKQYIEEGEQLMSIHKNISFNNTLNQAYKTIIFNLREIIESIIQDVKKTLKKKKIKNFNKLATYAKILKNGSWIDEKLKDRMCDEAFDKISKKILQHAKDIETNIIRSNLSNINNYDKISALDKEIENILNMKCLTNYVDSKGNTKPLIEGLDKIINETNTIYKRDIKHGFDQIFNKMNGYVDNLDFFSKI